MYKKSKTTSWSTANQQLLNSNRQLNFWRTALDQCETALVDAEYYGSQDVVAEWPGSSVYHRLESMPLLIAQELGGVIMPAITTLCAAPMAPPSLVEFLPSAKRRANSCIERCDEPIKHTIKRPCRLERVYQHCTKNDSLLVDCLMLVSDAMHLAKLPRAPYELFYAKEAKFQQLINTA